MYRERPVVCNYQTIGPGYGRRS